MPLLRSHRLLLAALIALTIAGPTRSARADVAQEDAIRAHLEFLASDLLEGRAAGSRGYDIAAAYVAAQFQMLGLKPGGGDGTYLQKFDLVEATPVIPAATVVLERTGERTGYEYATDFLPGTSYRSADASVAAPMTFVGFGVSAPELGYDDLADVDLDGRIAVAFSGAPSTFSPNERAYYSWSGSKLEGLTERGAIGLVTLYVPDDLERVPWERRVAMSWVPRMRLLDSSGVPVDDFPQIRASVSFDTPKAATLFAGSGRTLDEAVGAAVRGEPQAFPLEGRLTIALKTALGRTSSSNVVGVLEGSDPALKSEYVVVTAHLDHIGRGAAIGGDTIYNGAYDNASGSAILLEIARSIVAAGPQKRSIVFAAVGAEERGLLGSDFFARHPPMAAGRIVANVNMDMPLALTPMADVVAFGAQHSSLGAVAGRAAAAEDFSLTPDPYPEEVFFVRSDQFSFVRQGIPALYFDTGITSRDPAVDARMLLQQFLKQNYHQPSDEISLPIDYGTLAGLARTNARVVLEVADAPAAPRWNDGDFFGGKFGRR
jgi:hypothetical protein